MAQCILQLLLFPCVLFRHVDRWLNSLITTVLCAFGLSNPAAVTFSCIAAFVVGDWTCRSSQKRTIWVSAVNISLFQSLAGTMKLRLHWELQSSRCNEITPQICKTCSENLPL